MAMLLRKIDLSKSSLLLALQTRKTKSIFKMDVIRCIQVFRTALKAKIDSIKMYSDVSKCIQVYQNVFRCNKMYPVVFRLCKSIKMYSDASKRFKHSSAKFFEIREINRRHRKLIIDKTKSQQNVTRNQRNSILQK